MKSIGRILGHILFTSRWLLVPVYIGLSVALLLLSIKFFQQVLHASANIWHLSEQDFVLGILSLIDLTLVGSLIVMVMFTGYENFISRLEINSELTWLKKLDAGSLKLKVAVSIVAISSIRLLGEFMSIDADSAGHFKWYILGHLTFVVSAFAMGAMDMISKKKGALD